MKVNRLSRQDAILAPLVVDQLAQPTERRLGEFIPEDAPTWIEAARAAAEWENTLAWVARSARSDNMDAFGDDYGWDEMAPGEPIPDRPAFNPYRHVLDNWSDEERKEFDLLLRGGYFESVQTPEDLEHRKEYLRAQMHTLETMAKGGFTAGLVGSLAGALTDPVTYVPVVGLVNRARLMGRPIVAGAGMGFASALAAEMALHSVQDLRTLEESLANLVFSTGLGTLGGAFVAYAARSHPMHPANPANPFRPENLDRGGVAVLDADGGVRMHYPDGDPRSVGAMAATTPDEIRAVDGLMSKTSATRWLSSKFRGATLVSRALDYSSDKARRGLVSLMDMGGTLTNLNRKGVATGASAEDYKQALQINIATTFLRGETIHRELLQKLGELGHKGTALKDVISPEDYSELTRRHLLGTYDEAARADLEAKFGRDAARVVEEHANRYAEVIQKTNEVFERELMAIDKLQRPEVVAERTHKFHEAATRVAEMQAAGDTFSPEEIATARRERDIARDQLNTELAKHESLGRNYGHAQLWDSHTIEGDVAGFEEFLTRILAREPSPDWLTLEKGLEPKEWERIKAEEPERARELLQEWVGDEVFFDIAQAESRVAQAEENLKRSHLDLADAARDYGWVDRRTHELSLQEARAVRDRVHAAVTKRRSDFEVARAERDALVRAGDAGRISALARDSPDAPVTPAERIAQLEATIERAESNMGRLMVEDAAHPMGAWNSGEFKRWMDAWAATTRRLEVEAGPAKDHLTPAAKRALAKARDADANLRRADNRLRAAEAKLAHYDEKLTRVETAVDDAKKIRATLKAVRSEAAKNRRMTLAELKKAKRALKKAGARTPLTDEVEKIRRALVNRDEMPLALSERIAFEPGRAKARRIHLSKEERLEAEKKGYLQTNLAQILHAQYESLSGYIGLSKSMRDMGYRGTEDWEAFTRDIRDDYQRIADERKLEGAERTSLMGEADRAILDAATLKDRLLGTEQLGVRRGSWVHWLSRKAREANLIRYGSGFLLASIPDVANVYLRSGPLASLVKNYGRAAAKLIRTIPEEKLTEMSAMIRALELGGVDTRTARLWDAEDALEPLGVGRPGTAMHTITSKFDQAARKTTDVVIKASGMRAWNRTWKSMTAFHRAAEFFRKLPDYDNLSELERADWASLGIGQQEAARLNKYLQKYAEKDADGIVEPHFEKWGDAPDARLAKQDFIMAIQRDMSRSIVTPGIGDRPVLMSREAGRVWLQLQSFNFAIMNRLLIPASQRMATFKDMRVAGTFARLAMLGALTMAVKAAQRGDDPVEMFTEERWTNTALELTDRMGLLSYMSPYVDSALKVAAMGQEAAFGEVFVGPTNRYHRNGWLASLAGPTGGLVGDVQRVGSALASGETEGLARKLSILAPLGPHYRMLDSLHTLLNEQ